MPATRWIAAVAALALAAPAFADKVITVKSHTDAVQMMGKGTPAKDEVHKYWFGGSAIRYDAGDLTTIVDLDAKKLFYVQHDSKTYSAIDLPIDFKKLVPPEMAPMMEQMSTMMNASAKVADTGEKGSYAGFSCEKYKIDISMAMMNMTMNSCVTKSVPVDFSRYKELVQAQSEMFPSMGWMKELTKLEGFPVRSDTTTTMMGKTFGSWQEMQSVDDVPAPAGTYAPPSGYTEKEFNPMGQGGPRGRH